MNKRQVIGLLTFSVAIAGTVYCIKKYRDSKLANDEDVAMTLSEARKLLNDRPDLSNVTEYHKIERREQEMTREDIEEIQDEAHDEVSWNQSFTTVSNDTPTDDYYHDLDFNSPLSATLTEEEKILRYDPNSIQALHQFTKMELADLIPNSAEYQILKRLFVMDFEPLNDGDEILRSQLEDYRQEFFGPVSQWNHQVCYGDVICHYARLIDYNIGGGIGQWIIRLVRNVEFRDIAQDHEYGKLIEELNQHEYRNSLNGYYGLFRLDEFAMHDAQGVADESVDGEITYDIEYNEFLKHMI